MTVQLDIQIVQGQRWTQFFEVADLVSAGSGLRMHIRDHHGATLLRAGLTHDGATNARVSFTEGGILANLGATISTGWDLGGHPLRRWVYSIERYSLTDADDVTVTHAGAAVIIANPTDENSVDEVAPFPSFNLFALRFDIEQVLTSEQKARVLAALGISPGGSPTVVHADTTLRDATDSHPMAAITGLVAALTGKETAGSVATHDADTGAHGQTATGRAVLTAASTAAARTAIGLGNVDNTSDAGKPISTATQTALDGKQSTSEKGSAGGYASLDSGGKVPQAQLPAIAITEYLGEVANQTAMLALSGQKGDWCIRTDTGAVWIITGTDPALLGSWTSVSYPASPVTSVAGRTGDVTISEADVSGLGTAAALDVPESGNAASGEVVKGSDSRLTDSRTPTSHTHAPSDITSGGATTGQVLQWNGSAWVPATPSGGGATPAGSGAELQARSDGTTFQAVSGSYYDAGTGRIGIGVGTSPGGRLHVAAGSSTEIPLILQGAASQTAALSEWRDSSGSVLAALSPTATTGLSLFGAGRSRLTLKTDGYDPVITNDGSGALQLNIVRSGVDWLKLDNNTRAAVFYSNTNARILISFTDGSILSTYYANDFVIQGHTRAVDEPRRAMWIKGGPQHTAATTNLAGGHLYLVGGAGASASAGAAHGGNLYLRGGPGYGTGHDGHVILDNLPTSPSGLPAGAAWNDSGVVKIA